MEKNNPFLGTAALPNVDQEEGEAGYPAAATNYN
jgi:hypothetical protein